MTSLRDRALQIIARVVPSDYGDALFAKIIDGLYEEAPHAGTTCGFLASYLLYELGVRAPEIVNRNDEAWGLRYQIGGNISRLIAGAKALGAFRPGAEGIKPGDIYFVSNGTSSSEHVGVFIRAIDGRHWQTADGGQTNGQGHQAARYVTRDFDGTHLGSPNGQKVIQGYIDIEALPLAAAPAEKGRGLGRTILLVGGGVFAAGAVVAGVIGLLSEDRETEEAERPPSEAEK